MGANQNIISNLAKDKYTIKAQSTTTISFNGASPNYFKITNGGATSLYLGVSMMPTEDFFDEKIAPASSKLHVDAHGKEQIYIYNPSITDANIIITSFKANFDPTVLAMSGLGQDFSEIDFSGEVDASGDLKTLLESMNDTSFNYIPMLMTIRDNLDRQRCTIFRQEANTGSDITLKMFYIEFLSNDSDSDIELTINNVKFTLKAHEVLNKVHFTRQLNIKIPSGATFRVIGG